MMSGNSQNHRIHMSGFGKDEKESLIQKISELEGIYEKDLTFFTNILIVNSITENSYHKYRVSAPHEDGQVPWDDSPQVGLDRGVEAGGQVAATGALPSGGLRGLQDRGCRVHPG